MKKVFKTTSATATAELGRKIGSLINEPCVIAFCGGMGSGKTCFTTGFVKGLDYYDEVSSPTFAIVNEYLGGRLPVYHFDMYRIADEDELYSIGFYDYMDEDAVLVIEWSENIEDALPPDTIYIKFSNQTENNRTLSLECAEEKDFLKEL
ncbi:MAG: tRNA (adenosine(37)-N6)-threonylcarbamoyltransferase complex ATPase subunit type 1 TsaE [Clostridia bacterium]|nr:tRNA (adenosine(37)-N6)-threonylcarbamoyltransferase complex ATPase subunit type 1 TsaE [Clostridia bacterium]